MSLKIHIPEISAEGVEAVVFDLGGVLLDLDFSRTVEAYAALHIQGLTTADVLDGNESTFRDLELGLLAPAAFLTRLRQKYPTLGAVSDDEIWNAWNAILVSFDPKQIQLLRELKKQKPIYLLSNTNLPHRLRYRELFREQVGGEFDDLFRHCFYSDELHLRKPDPHIYHRVAEEIGIPPARILFIDDNQPNIAQARAEGWQTYCLAPGRRITELFEL